MATAEQDQWKEICAAVRAGIAKQVELMTAMNPGEISSLVGAVDLAIWCEIKAESFDEAVEQHRRQLEREALFGS